jgi:hypothetical protein
LPYTIAALSFALTGLLGQGRCMSVFLHHEDLPEGVLAAGPVAVDTETMGLITQRDRLCLLQISDGGGDEHLVRFAPDSDYAAPNLRAVLADPARLKLFHFARFDLAAISHHLEVAATPVFCTKIASRLVRTYTDRHGLKELVKEMLGTDISKQQQSSDWGGCTRNLSTGSHARAGLIWHKPVSTSCRTAPTSILRVGRKSIYSGTVKVGSGLTAHNVRTSRSRTHAKTALGNARRAA